MSDKLISSEKRTAYILTLPAVLLVFGIILFPIFSNVWISFKQVECKVTFQLFISYGLRFTLAYPMSSSTVPMIKYK